MKSVQPKVLSGLYMFVSDTALPQARFRRAEKGGGGSQYSRTMHAYLRAEKTLGNIIPNII